MTRATLGPLIAACLAAALLALRPGPARGQGADDILGAWDNEEKTSKIAVVRLDLRGYVGIPLFGRTSHWTREAP